MGKMFNRFIISTETMRGRKRGLTHARRREKQRTGSLCSGASSSISLRPEERGDAAASIRKTVTHGRTMQRGRATIEDRSSEEDGLISAYATVSAAGIALGVGADENRLPCQRLEQRMRNNPETWRERIFASSFPLSLFYSTK